MKALRDFYLAMAAGLLLHQTSSITRKMPDGWQELTGTTIGVIGTVPAFILWLWRLMPLQRKSPFTWAVTAFHIAFLGVGAGVALGWVLDTLLRVDRKG